MMWELHVMIFAHCVSLSGSVKVYLAAIQPNTGDWPAGESMSYGAQKMVEWINDNPNILPGYDIEVIWQNGSCDTDHGQKMFLQNIFSKTFFPVAEPEIAGITPVGLLGPGCSGPAAAVAATAFYAKMPIISNSATRPSLSDRSRFPGFFRTLAPDTAFTEAWLAIVKGFGFDEVAVATGVRGDDWHTMAEPLLLAASKFELRLVGPSMPHMDAKIKLGMDYKMYGWEVTEAGGKGMDIASDLVDQFQALKPRPPRFMVLLMFAPQARALLCAAHKKPLFGIMYMTMGWFSSFWWRTGIDDLPCSQQDMEETVNLTMTANMNQRRPDLHTVLTCANGITAADFFSYYDEITSRLPGGTRLEGAATADAVCTFALMLHELLIARNHGLQELESYSQELYMEAFDILTATDFEGTQGRMRFIPGFPDPAQMVIIEQLQNVDANRAQEKTPLARYLDNTLTWTGLPIMLPGEKFAIAQGYSLVSDVSFVYGESGPLGPFKSCASGTMLNMMQNLCETCPADKTYVLVSRACLCLPGYSTTGNDCVPCAAGFFSDHVGSRSCKQCEAGGYTIGAGKVTCQVCDPGRYQNQSGQTSCRSCPGGKHSTNPGAFECTDCEPGQFSESAAKSCKPCPRGRYAEQSGQGECTSCGADLSTPDRGAASPDFCGCPKGRFFPMPQGAYAAATFFAFANGSAGCTACPWGMDCPGFFPGVETENTAEVLAGHHRQPVTLKRFFAVDEEPYTAYLCRQSEWCPGYRVPGPGSCAENRKGFGCGSCKKFYKAEKNGACRKCGAADAFTFKALALAIFMVFPFLIYFSYDVNMTHAIQSPKHVALSTGHIFVYFLEGCAILGDMNIKWPHPMNTMLKASSIFSFDLDALSPACALGDSYKFETKYAIAVSIPLIIGTYLGVMLVISKVSIAVFKLPCRGLRFERTVTTFGIIYVALYVAVCRSTLRIFECFKVHPDGRRQLSTFPYVECFKNRWWSMVPLGIGACLLYGVLTFAGAIWLCHVAVARFLRNDAKFCKCFGFLFHEFRRDCWWWLPVILIRNLLLPMALVIAPGDGQAQSGIFVMINLLYLVLQLTFWPWLTYSVNVSDTLTMGVGLLLISSLTSSFLDETANKPDEAVYATLLTSTLVIALVILLALWGGNLVCHYFTKMTGINSDSHGCGIFKRPLATTSDDALASSLLQVSQTIVQIGKEDAEKRIAHFSHSDHRTTKNYVATALIEFCEATSIVSSGLPPRLVVGQKLMSAMDSAKQHKQEPEERKEFHDNESESIPYYRNTEEPPIELTAADPDIAIKDVECLPEMPDLPMESAESPLERIKPTVSWLQYEAFQSPDASLMLTAHV